ncbi:HD-GYP domain-containing protein [Nitrosomonas ureae]|uniref:HDIG domain-containing protein n=1 Tax=Nitrosomonas ureae TaxID=44577 RepID=A0A1H2DPX4_9PROT|nr:HD-GYP domain-containing protein [Nitrosomonas ureae]ALQ49906.1 phosphodiesterase [Nitrosomonas ureae]SDT84856.1 HDIG domain-containing protein [Nitrosomonas ureae]
MIKKVQANEVRLGMYIHQIRGNWMEHPFWRKSFKLIQQKDLDKLVSCNLEEIWIDTSKGLDVVKTIQVKNPDGVDSDILPQSIKKPVARVSVEEELHVAKIIQNKAKEAVAAMFDDVRMGKALEIEEAKSLVNEINQSMERNPNALLTLIRLKNVNEYTYMHSVAVCVLMVALGRHLGLSEVQIKQAGTAGLLHDIGKMVIPNEVLNKPGKLTDEEFTIMKSHPVRGWEILKSCYQVHETALDVCLHHHERVDGKGYPEKLSGDALTLFARMGAVCDVYDAISSDRCYKAAWSPAEAIRKMASWKDGHFDESIFQAFVKTVGIYPSGTLLKLQSGRLGVVIEQSTKKLTTPIVKIFFSTRANAHIPAEIIDISKGMDSIESLEDPVKWGFDLNKIQGI